MSSSIAFAAPSAGAVFYLPPQSPTPAYPRCALPPQQRVQRAGSRSPEQPELVVDNNFKHINGNPTAEATALMFSSINGVSYPIGD